MRTLLLVGAVLGLLGAAAGVVVGLLVPEGDEPALAVLAVGGGTTAVLLGLVGVLIGWFGRERDEVVGVTIGTGLLGAVVLLVASLVVDDWQISSVVIAPVVAAVGGALGSLTWRVGDAICDFRELPTMDRLLAPAFPQEYPGTTTWIAEAGPTLHATLDELAARTAPGEAVEARAVGVLLGLPRDRPVVTVLSAERLAIQPVDLRGAPAGETLVLTPAELAEVSIRNLAADGSTRREGNAYDDVADIRTAGGSRLQLRLPYGNKGSGKESGGPEEIWTWLRTRAATYR